MTNLVPPIYKVTVLEHEESKESIQTLGLLPAPYGAVNTEVHLSKVLLNQRLTPESHFQDVRKI